MDGDSGVGFGPHLTLDGYSLDGSSLDDVNSIYRTLDELPDKIGMTKIMPPYVSRHGNPSSPDYGLSGFVLIAESHIAIHTYPNRCYLRADIFSCKPFAVDDALGYLMKEFNVDPNPARHSYKITDRGTEFPKDIAAARAEVGRDRKRARAPRAAHAPA